jgi:acetolactate synthase-1/3 small subunit
LSFAAREAVHIQAYSHLIDTLGMPETTYKQFMEYEAMAEKHVISVLVENRPGALTRSAGLFARRGFNIETLSVGPSEDENVSRITMTVDGATHSIEQITKQLNKLVNVIKIRELRADESVARELALFKIASDDGRGNVVIEIANIFRGRIVDVSRQAITIELTGSEEKIAAFEEMVRPLGIIEMMRSGQIAISRGGEET